MMSNYHILVAEDDADIRDEVCDFLAEQGFRCTCAKDGEAARQALQQTRFDLLITDFRMPRLDGMGLLQWCRDARVVLAVIFMSADRQLPPQEHITLGGRSAAVLVKPFSLTQLEAVVYQFLHAQVHVQWPNQPRSGRCRQPHTPAGA